MTTVDTPSAARAPAIARLTVLGRRVAGGDALPAWYSHGLYSAIVWSTTLGVTAVVTLGRAKYSPVACAVVATVATLAAWPFRPRARPDEPSAHGPALALVAIVLVFLAFAAAAHSEHLFTDRDPGIYVNAGRSIARTHRVHPNIAASPFDDTRAFAKGAVGFVVANHQLVANFLNFLPVLLALGWSAGGDTGLLLVPAILGALALLALYALATEIVGPRWALLGPALLALAPLQSWFSRDAYAELPLEVLALGGLWLFLEARRDGRAVTAAIAGVVLGTVTFVRIDALALFVALPPALAVEVLRAGALDAPVRRRRRIAIASFAATLALTAWTGVAVSQRQSPGYTSDLAHNVHLLELALGAGVLVALAIFVGHAARAGLGRRLARNNVVVAAAVGLTVAASVYAYKFRPRNGTAPLLQTAARQSVRAAARKAWEAFFLSASFRWFAWYLGTVTLVLIVVGFVVLGIRAARSDSPAFMVLAAAVPMTLLYIARPSVTPDHFWAMRRYLPIALPVMTIAAAAAVIWLAAAVATRRPRLRAPVVVVALAAMLIPAARAGRPFVAAQAQGGALDAVHELCRAAGPHAAIAVEASSYLSLELPQTVRGFCGVPAAGLRKGAPQPMSAYVLRWKNVGRQLYLASPDQSPPVDAGAKAVEVAHVVVADAREPARTFGRRPDAYAPRPVEVWLYRVDPL